jgi:hypothetical protein
VCILFVERTVLELKKTSFIAGILVGAIAFGGITAAATAGIIAMPTSSKVILNGTEIPIEAYTIHGNNFFMLHDIAKNVDFSAVWDGPNNSILIDTLRGFDPTGKPPVKTETSSNILTVPNNGDKLFIAPTGSFVKCDDGTLYEIKQGIDLNKWSGFTANNKWHPPEALPEPTCDWSIYPEIELPDVIVNRIRGTWDDPRANDYQQPYDELYILNLHEMKRVQYTLYNWIYPETVKYYEAHPEMLKSIAILGRDPSITAQVGQPIHFGDLPHQTQQGFYPWDENEVVKQVKVSSGALFSIEVWDIYHNGNYLRTEYKMQTSQKYH